MSKLYISIERPTDEEIHFMRMLDKGAIIVSADSQRVVKRLLDSGLLFAVGESLRFSALGTLVLAAYDAEAAGDRGQVEAATMRVLTAANEVVQAKRGTDVCRLVVAINKRIAAVDALEKALDAATDKAGVIPIKVAEWMPSDTAALVQDGKVVGVIKDVATDKAGEGGS